MLFALFSSSRLVVGDEVGANDVTVTGAVAVGSAVRASVGVVVGVATGACVCLIVGVSVGMTVGFAVGFTLGARVGNSEGDVVGDVVGSSVGVTVGDAVGDNVNRHDVLLPTSGMKPSRQTQLYSLGPRSGRSSQNDDDTSHACDPSTQR